jgi:hypothetical protein
VEEAVKRRVPLEAVAEQMQDYLIPLAKQGIVAAVEAHHIADGRGANAKSFGANCWTFLEELFRSAVREGRIPFELADAQGCILYYPGWLLHHYRVGSYEHEDIGGAFPRDGKVKLELEADGQQVLPFADKRPEVLDAVPAVFAFLANSKDGLVAAYCCEIDEIEGGKVRRWGRTIRLRLDATMQNTATSADASRDAITLEAPTVTFESSEEAEGAK